MINRSSPKQRIRLPTFDTGGELPVVPESPPTAPPDGAIKLTAADLAYVRRYAQRRLGGGAGFSRVKAEAVRVSREEARVELEELALPMKHSERTFEQRGEIERRCRK